MYLLGAKKRTTCKCKCFYVIAPSLRAVTAGVMFIPEHFEKLR